MLLKVNLQSNLNSMYECDRCKALITTRERHTLYHQNYRIGKIKYCDLCETCFRAMDRGIKKGKKDARNKT